MSKKVTMLERVKGIFKTSEKRKRIRKSKIRDLLRGTSCEGCTSMSYSPESGSRLIICQNPKSDHYGHLLDGKLHTCSLHSSIPKKVTNQINMEIKS